MQTARAIGKWQQCGTWTIRFQLLATVNVVLAVFAAIALAYDYRREISERLESKHVALEEEAKTLLPAIGQIRREGRDRVQHYIDAVCARMQESHSPGHHIAVEMDGDTIQATAHHRASAELLAAMRQATPPDFRSRFGQSELVVGVFKQGDATVYVSETLNNLYRSVIGDVLRRLIGFIGLALIAGLIVNLVLARIVARPLDKLVATVQKIGEGRLSVQARPFRSAELNYLAGEINAMSASLAAADRDRKTQMAKAREIQQNLLPSRLQTPGLKIAHLFQPADEVGGDYYDVLPLGDGEWLFCVADVTGHGVPAAMSAAMLKALLLQASEQFASPAEMLEFINKRLKTVNLPGDFVSMLLLRAVPQGGCFHYASAGHESAWLMTPNGQPRELPSTGMLLGVMHDADWEEATVELSGGERLLMVTDGVTEAFNEQQQCFGRQRLSSLLGATSRLKFNETAQRLDEALATHRSRAPQHDDVTVVLIEFASPNPR